jgi:hypothetical protein
MKTLISSRTIELAYHCPAIRHGYLRYYIYTYSLKKGLSLKSLLTSYFHAESIKNLEIKPLSYQWKDNTLEIVYHWVRIADSRLHSIESRTFTFYNLPNWPLKIV